MTPVPAFYCTRLFTNLKENDVLNPKSILYLRECQRHPLLNEFLVEVISNAVF
jgi:hypothetical protein